MSWGAAQHRVAGGARENKAPARSVDSQETLASAWLTAIAFGIYRDDMNDNIPLAAAYYLNGANFRVSAEKLGNTLELDS